MVVYHAVAIFTACAIKAQSAAGVACKCFRCLFLRFQGYLRRWGNPIIEPAHWCWQCGHSSIPYPQRFAIGRTLVIGISVAVVSGCVEFAGELEPVGEERLGVESKNDTTRIAGPRYWEISNRMMAGTLSFEEMGAFWSEYFTEAIRSGHSAVASRQEVKKWNLRLDIPTLLQQTLSLDMVARLSTTQGKDLISKRVWTIVQQGDHFDLTIEDIIEDRRIECLLDELPIDSQVVLTLAVRPSNDPNAELRVVCRQVFPVSVVP